MRQADGIAGWCGGGVTIALPKQGAEEDKDEAASKGKGAGEAGQAGTILGEAAGKVLPAVVTEQRNGGDGQRGAASDGERHGDACADEAPAPCGGKADNGATAWADADGDDSRPRAEGGRGGGIVMVVVMAAGAVCVVLAARTVAVEDVGADSDDEGGVGAVQPVAVVDSVRHKQMQQPHGQRNPKDGADPLHEGAADSDGEGLSPRGGLAEGEGGDDGFAVAGANGVQDAVKEAEAAQGQPGRGVVTVAAQGEELRGEVTLPLVLQALQGVMQRLPVGDEEDEQGQRDQCRQETG